MAKGCIQALSIESCLRTAFSCGICIYYGSPLVPAKAAATLPGVYYGSPLVPAKAAATLPGVYYGSALVPAKEAATLPGAQQEQKHIKAFTSQKIKDNII